MQRSLVNPCRHIAEFVENVGPSTAPGTAELVIPSVHIEYCLPAIAPQDTVHDFVVVFRPERKLPPLAVRGSGVDVVEHGFAVWISNGQGKTYITVVNASDVIVIFEGKVETFQTAS
jgi:hypothetical protein